MVVFLPPTYLTQFWPATIFHHRFAHLFIFKCLYEGVFPSSDRSRKQFWCLAALLVLPGTAYATASALLCIPSRLLINYFPTGSWSKSRGWKGVGEDSIKMPTIPFIYTHAHNLMFTLQARRVSTHNPQIKGSPFIWFAWKHNFIIWERFVEIPAFHSHPLSE